VEHLVGPAQNYVFRIDAAKLCAVWSCARTQGGGYDIDLKIYFRPQEQLYFGSVMSALALVASLAAVLLPRRRRSRRNERI